MQLYSNTCLGFPKCIKVHGYCHAHYLIIRHSSNSSTGRTIHHGRHSTTDLVLHKNEFLIIFIHQINGRPKYKAQKLNPTKKTIMPCYMWSCTRPYIHYTGWLESKSTMRYTTLQWQVGNFSCHMLRNISNNALFLCWSSDKNFVFLL